MKKSKFSLSLMMGALGLAPRKPQPQAAHGAVAKKGARAAFGLIDGAVFLLLAVAFIGGTMAAVKARMTQSDVTQEIQNVISLSTAAVSVKNQGMYPASLFDVVSKSGQMPATFTLTGTAPTQVAKSAWGGDISLYAGADNTADSGSFLISYDKVPEDACRQMVKGVKSGVLRYVSVGAAGSAISYGTTDLADGSAVTTLYSGASCAAAGSRVTWSTDNS